jgi:neutral ceramidase
MKHQFILNQQFRKGVFLCQVLVLLIIFSSCSSGPVIVVEHPGSTWVPEPGSEFRAGAAEVDITPPPGLPLFGHSWEAEPYAKGYWTRLKARAIVFEDRRGKRAALVQLDWGAVSMLLHREVAKRLVTHGIGPENLMLAASHTHAAPGGFFGAAFYNKFGSGRSGFYPQLLGWLADSISRGVEKAIADLAPARIGCGRVMVEGLSRNRSPEAWELNFCQNPLPHPYCGVIPEVHLLRVDHLDKNDPSTTLPIAAFVVAPVHATAVESKYKFYHGDLHGAASRYLAASISRQYKLKRPFVAAVAAGPQGDVSPDWHEQGKDEAIRLGHLLADHAANVFTGLDNQLKQVNLKYAYQEFLLPGALIGEEKHLCNKAMVGLPVLGGAEDGRSSVYGKFGIREGRTRKPRGCQGVKIPAGWFLSRFFINPKFLPRIAPFQVICFGDILTLAALPGEPTTETGRRIRDTLVQKSNTRQTALVAVANGYMSYIATAEEYAAQHFEGAFTLYGPNQAEFFREKLQQTASNLDSGDTHYLETRKFLPGRLKKIFSARKKAGNPGKWKSVLTIVKHDSSGRVEKVRFDWLGLKKKRLCSQLPTIVIENNVSLLIGPEGMPETDDGLNFEVKRMGQRYWSATWIKPEGLWAKGKCRIKVYRSGLEPLFSKEFFLDREADVKFNDK